MVIQPEGRSRGYANKQSNLERLENVLESATVLGLQFKGVTFLAKFCAQRMNETSNSNARLEYKSLALLGQVSSVALSWKSLLKDSMYRGMLDSWMLTKCDKGSELSASHSQVRILQRDLLLLRNRYERLNKDYLSLQNDSAPHPQQALMDSSGQDGFIIAHSLITYFSSFLDVLDGDLIEKSPAKPILVSRTVFESYSAWLKKEI